MIVMAIEASMDIESATNRTISGFVVKNAQFIAPIRISESALDAIETEVHLRQIQTADEKRPSWSEVTIFTHHSDHWTECFRTHVQIQYEDSTAKTPDRETEQENEHIRDHVQQMQATCRDGIPAPAFYKFCKEHGLNYGESFQLLEEIAWDREVSSTACISMSRLQPQSHRSPVHPAVLDSIFHMLLAQTSGGLQRSDSPTMVPRQLTKAWISAAPWQQATSSVHLASHAQKDVSTSSSPGIRGVIYCVSDEKTPLCIIENLSMVEISGSMQSQHDQTPDRTLLYNIAWKPKLSFLGARDLQSILQHSYKPFDDTVMEIYCPKITHALRTAAGKVLKKVSESQIRRGPEHLRKFRDALKYQHSLQVQEGRSKDLSNSDLESLLVECETQNPEWFFFPAVARALPELLRGETDSVELMFATRSGEKFYENVFARHMRDGRLQAFLDLATHENPGMKILEVGAGTGGFTSQLMAAFTEFEAKTGSAAFDTYTFTDISASFFDGARGRFSDYLDRMDFRVLDLEKDPEEAGFSSASHDVIFAGSVLHATSNLTRSLATLRKLLKPGGYLVIQEPTAPDNAWVNIGFGSVPGWWLAEEDWRQGSPLVDIEGWDRLLRETGFSGVDVALKDTENEVVHFSSVLLSRATSEPISQEQNGLVNGHADDQKITILLNQDSKAQQELAVELEKSFTVSKMIDFASISQEDLALSSDVVVSLIEVGSPRLVDLSESELQAIQGLIQGVSNMLWISAPVTEDGKAVHDPSFAATTGLLRGLRSEYRDKHIVSLSVESPTPQPLASIISDLLRDCFKKESPSSDIEFVVRDGQVIIGRLAQEKQFDEERLARVQPQLRDEAWKTGPALMLTTEVPGMLETLRWVEDTSRWDDLAPGDVEIEATVWPLSFRDIFIALAKLGNEGLGFECGGIVSRVGAECSGEFQPGDRVVMGVVGSIRSHPRAPKQVVHKIPDGVSLEDVVAAMTPAMTAWKSLVDIARLQSGEKILIHSAAGGTGQMAVEVAKSIGAEIFATVGTEEKRELLKSKFGIPDDHIFYSRNTSFAQGIQRVTKGYGVDVVLNSIAGDGLTASWECIAPYGRFIEIGKADIRANSSLSMGHFAKNASFAAVDLYHITLTNQRMTSQLMGKVIELISEGTIRAPQPLHAYSLSDTENAFRYMQSGKNTGRILLIKGDGDIVSKRIVHKSTWAFDPDSSYVVAGGLGGLGRCILQWMADKGAKHLIVLSRSGASSKAASDVVETLRSRGVSITTPPCDVSSREKLQAVLEECAVTMPPIKGCINAAMALQDAIFENMTHAQWKTTIQSKVLSSWNLHELLPRDMNFFILLSSLAGIYGTMAQSNYCSGCTYQDALARMRHNQGLGVSVSLDLGWMADVGIISERVEYQRNREATSDMAPVQGADLLAVLDHYCDPALPTSQSVQVEEQCQLLLGALTPLDFDLKAGEEAPSSLQRPLFQGFKVMQERAQRVSTLTGGEAAQKEALTPAMKFHSASSNKDRCEIVVDALKGRIARSLGVEQDDVVAEKTLSDYGVDSLMAVELRNWIRNDFGSAVTVFDIMGGASITAVGELVAAKADAAEAEAA
ncbi:unnamed protein product [Clonostachys solani]|uniref:Carrier domain-containing protein n=1 Tax=Clonostachys solani TaxID=160281 RepID=A0A9N9Z9X0_9HYPO|nr:unnamed protein product [Clonostachys solani]